MLDDQLLNNIVYLAFQSIVPNRPQIISRDECCLLFVNRRFVKRFHCRDVRINFLPSQLNNFFKRLIIKIQCGILAWHVSVCVVSILKNGVHLCFVQVGRIIDCVTKLGRQQSSRIGATNGLHVVVVYGPFNIGILNINTGTNAGLPRTV